MRQTQVVYRINKEANLILAKAFDEVPFEDVLLFVQCLLADPDYRDGMNLLYDARCVTGMKGEITSYQAAATIVSDQTLLTVPARTAVLVVNDDPKLMAYVDGYALMASSSMVEHKGFEERQIGELVAYLQLNEFPEAELTALSLSRDSANQHLG